MSHKYASLEDTVYFSFGSNDTSGSGDDGSTPVFDVRFEGDFFSSAPLYSAAANLLTHGNYPAGCHEIAVPATTGNGFIASGTYSVYTTVLVDSQNPTGFIGSFSLQPVISNSIQVSGTVQTANDNGADINTLVSRVTDNVSTAAKLIAYIQLLARSDSAINTDNSTELIEINASGGSGVGDFDNQSDSEEAIITAIATRAPSGEYDTELDANMSTRAPANEYDTQLDVNVSTRAPANEYDTQLDANVSTRSSHTAANVWAVGSRTLTSFGTLVADTTTAVWAAATAALTTAGSIGKKLADWVVGNVLQIAGSSAAATGLAASAATVVVAAAAAGTLSTTEMTTTLTETTNDHYKGRIIIWTSGDLQNQATDITAYTGATKLLTFTGVTEAPGDGDTFVIV